MLFWNCTPGIFGNLLYLYTYDCVLTLQGYSISDLRGMTQSLPAIVSPAPKCLSSTCHHAYQVPLLVLGVVQCSRLPLTKKSKTTPNQFSPEQIIGRESCRGQVAPQTTLTYLTVLPGTCPAPGTSQIAPQHSGLK